jgi:Flp pilus assembly protein TadG
MASRKFQALGRDPRGVALTEFAFALPLMILMYLGGYQLCDAISAYRKVTTGTRSLADVTSQYTTITDNDLDTVLSASQQVMSPYSVGNAKLVISQIAIDKDRNATVDWSRGKNISGLVKGSSFTIPDSIRQANTSLLVAQIQYLYKPVAASALIGDIPMKDQIIMMPRATSSITWKNQ